MLNNIRALRLDKGWSLRELADRISTPGAKIHYSTVQKLELSQRKLSQVWMERFAEVFDVPLSEIIKPAADFGGITLKAIPVIGLVSAGSWREAVHEPEDVFYAPVKGPNTFALKVRGDSMDQVAPEGAMVTVDPDQNDLHDHGYYVVMNGDAETTFKQYRANPARLEPVSSNTTYEPIILGKAAFTIVGRVIGTYLSLA